MLSTEAENIMVKKTKVLIILTLIVQFTLIFNSVNTFQVRAESSQTTTKTLEFTHHFSVPEIIKNSKYFYVHLPEVNSVMMSQSGYKFPTYIKTFELPLGTSIKKITCTYSKVYKIHLPNGITSQTSNVYSDKENIWLHPKTNEKVNDDCVFPTSWYFYKLSGGLNKNSRRTTFLKIQLNSVRYNYTNNELQFIDDIRLEIKCIEPKNSVLSSSEYDFLIISYDKYKPLLEALVSHKEDMNIKTKLVTLGEIYNSKYFQVQGRDKPEKIKYFIKDTIENWGIKYVMLVGGYKQLPIRYSFLNDRSATWEYERRFISDLYYADIYDGGGDFSDWDSNKNGYYGEYDHDTPQGRKTDVVDLYPDVYIGRLACRNKREVKTVVNKIIQYEKATNKNDWFKNIVLCGGDLYLNDPCGDIAEGEYILEAIAEQMKEFNIIHKYPKNGLNMLGISRAINQGTGFVVFEGAGGHDKWGVHPYNNEKWIYYYNLNIRLLRNRHMLPVVLVSGAHLGQFNLSRECFNWAFVSKRNGGAIASIGSTGLCWIAHGKNVTSYYLGNLHLRLFQEYNNTHILGEIIGNAITNYLNAFDWGHHGVAESFHIKAAEELELFGDPTLKLPDKHIKEMTNDRIFDLTNPLCRGNILYVGGAGTNNYTRIQDAVDNASDSDMIFVYDGTYYENINVNKSISLVGQDKEEVILKSHENGIFITANKTYVAGFTIESNHSGKNEIGIRLSGSGNSLENLIVSGFDWGIFLENVSDDIIRDNDLIKNNEYAIFIKNSFNISIQENTIKQNMYGIWSENSHRLEIIRNTFSFNSWYALWLDESHKSNIRNNSFMKNWYDVYLYSTDDSEISGNYISYNQHGPQFVDSSNNAFIHNHIEENEHYGIFIGCRSKNNIFMYNNFIENARNVRDDFGSYWDENYWSDYIGIKIRILERIGIPYKIPGNKKQWDWHPTLEPYDI